jgi:hypothetical protein
MEIVACGELSQLSQKLKPLVFVGIIHALAKIVAKKQHKFTVICDHCHSGTVIGA